jgi:UDP-hydrolysing UDP-N-acetyl-D-glucosamine 2-epimerase
VNRRKICVVVGSRANYASIKSAMRAIQAHPQLELQLVVGASAVLDRYGAVADLIRADGFEPAAEVFMLVEGETPATMAKSTGLGLIELPTVFLRLKPDFVLTVGDRFETMATTLAAAYMNIPIAHTMGGEVSGTIDESIRHAVTKFAHVHFPASRDAAERIAKLGEKPEDIHLVGCPRIDLVAEILSGPPGKALDGLFGDGVGSKFDLDKPFLLVSEHPVTTEYGAAEGQILSTLEAVDATGLPAIVLWPNADAGSEDIARGMRKWREQGRGGRMHFFKNLPAETYLWLMKRTACLVNVGSRQTMRERGANVIDAAHDRLSVETAIRAHLAHGPFVSEPIYGDGKAGARIADILATKTVDVQKRITY